MSLATNITNLATRAATESKSIRTLVNGNKSSLSELKTTNKNNLVDAINELLAAIGGAGAKIDDTTVSLATVWSSSKTDSEIKDAVTSLVDSSPETLDTLKELAAALGNDSNFATTITEVIGTKAPSANPTFTGTVSVPDGSFTFNKTAGLQAALDQKMTMFVDPNADRIVFWDDSTSSISALALDGLQIVGTTLSPVPASETVAGIVERATLEEVATGVDTVRYVTPQALNQQIETRAGINHNHTASQITDFDTAAKNAMPAASETTAGKVELATSTEISAGIDTTRAVTPAGLKTAMDTKAASGHGHSLADSNIVGTLPIAQVPTGTSSTTVALGNHTHVATSLTDFASSVDSRVNTLVPAATATAAGKIEIATDVEVASGTDVSRAVTPATLRSVTGVITTDFVTIFESALV